MKIVCQEPYNLVYHYSAGNVGKNPPGTVSSFYPTLKRRARGCDPVLDSDANRSPLPGGMFYYLFFPVKGSVLVLDFDANHLIYRAIMLLYDYFLKGGFSRCFHFKKIDAGRQFLHR